MEDKTLLSDAEITRELATLEGWQREGIYLRKDFVFANYKEINQFLPHLTKTIVSQNHHPDFSFVGARKLVAISVTTTSAKALTRADLDLARALNAWRG